VANDTPLTILDLVFSGKSLRHLKKALHGRRVDVIDAYDFNEAELLCEGGIRYFIDAHTRFCRCSLTYIPSPPPYPPSDLLSEQVVGCNILLYILASDSFDILQASRVFHNVVVRFLGRRFEPGMWLRGQRQVIFDPNQYQLFQVDHDHLTEEVYHDAGMGMGILKGATAVEFTCARPGCAFVDPKKKTPTKAFVPTVSFLS
jgi:hypothetical protein